MDLSTRICIGWEHVSRNVNRSHTNTHAQGAGGWCWEGRKHGKREAGCGSVCVYECVLRKAKFTGTRRKTTNSERSRLKNRQFCFLSTSSSKKWKRCRSCAEQGARHSGWHSLRWSSIRRRFRSQGQIFRCVLCWGKHDSLSLNIDDVITIDTLILFAEQ